MAVGVPSLEGSFFITDPQSIIGYVWKRYCRTPKDTISILPDLIISLPYQVSQFGRSPSTLVTNMTTDLQGVLSRIFATDRTVTVNVTQLPSSSDPNGYDVNVSITYTKLDGEIDQIGQTISINAVGELVLPEDTLPFNLLL